MIPHGSCSHHPSTTIKAHVWMSAEHQLIASVPTASTPAGISESTLRARLRQAVRDRFCDKVNPELEMATVTETLEYFEDAEYGPQFGVVLVRVGEPA